VSWFGWRILGLAVLAGADAKCCPTPPQFLIHIWNVWQALDLLEHKPGQQALRLDG